MSVGLREKYPHISFTKNWEITENTAFLLGECDGLVKAICHSPILPELRKKLLNISLIKGAQATTAIEGNTLSEEDVQKVKEGKELAPSQKYMENEVKNILDSLDWIFLKLIQNAENNPINPELIKVFHKKIGENLGEHFDAIPGKFREDNRTVGNYRCPDYQDVTELMSNFCTWLKSDFHYWSGKQKYTEAVIQAIVAHVYLEWIHPFGDGNGRTGRLLEFYILVRGKTPDIASHILSNHYNQTRTEYYRQLANATIKRSLTQFIEYALVGFRDGLEAIFGVLQSSQLQITWQKHVYDVFEKLPKTSEAVMKRRRRMALDLPPSMSYTAKEIILATPEIALLYGKANLSDKQMERELDELTGLGLLLKKGNKYQLNISVLSGFMAVRKI